jgi:hypothetical protein
MSRSWYKRFGYDFLYGSTLKELSWKEAWVWSALLDLASSGYDDGKILVRVDEGYSPQALAIHIKTPLSVVKSALDKLSSPMGKDGIPKINIDSNNIITINKWNLYQSEYERLRKYKKGTEKGTTSGTENPQKRYSIDIDIDKEVDIDINKEKETYKEKENKGSKSLTPKQKYNYAKGMELERKRIAEKKQDIAERELFNKAKNCYKTFYDFGEVCKKQDKPECDICLLNQNDFKSEISSKNIIPDSYAQCENYILRNCHIKDHGTANNRKYDFCYNCAWDSIWGENAGKWGNYIIDIKYKKG